MLYAELAALTTKFWFANILYFNGYKLGVSKRSG
jgi:hypothetical protein